MMKLNCEYVRDVYPDVLNGTAEGVVVTAINEHLAECAECRAEARLIEMLQASVEPVPAGLHERVLRAATQPYRSVWRFRRGDVAMAATLAAALLGGGLYLQTQNEKVADVPAPTAVHAPVHGVGAVGVEDAMMSGKSSLDDLSVEQLEKLLGEVQS